MAVPVITGQPDNFISVHEDSGVGAGKLNTYFRIFTEGEGAGDTYQWYKNAAPVSGATTTIYAPPYDINDHGALFTCLVTNADGSTLSQDGFANMVAGDEYWDEVEVYAKLEDAPGTTNLLNEKTGGPTLTSVNGVLQAGEGYLGNNGWVGNGVDSYIMVSALGQAADCMIEFFFKTTATSAMFFRDVNWSVGGVSILQWPQVSIEDGLGDTVEGHPPDGVRIEIRNGLGAYGSIAYGKASAGFNTSGNTHLRQTLFTGEYIKAEMYRDYFQLGGTLSVSYYDNRDTTDDYDVMEAPDGYSIGASVFTAGPPALVFDGTLSHVRITRNARSSSNSFYGGSSQSPPFPTGPLTTGIGPALRYGPVDRAAGVGEQVSFFVREGAVTGALTYQWQLDGADLPGETDRSLIFVAEAGHDGVKVTCIVTDDSGAVTTPYGLITISNDPCEGITSVTVSVEVDSYSTEPVTYEWYMADQLLAGYDTASINLPVTSADSGKAVYVKVSNPCGVEISDPVTIPLVCEG